MKTKKAFYPTQSSNSAPFSKVIIIDDNDVDHFINESLLHEISLSREIRRELSPANAISELKKTHKLADVPELIFFDLKMENKDGYNFLEEFRRLSDFIRDKCKIVVFAGEEKIENKHRILMNPSVIRYITKPIDVVQLKEILR